MHTRKQMTTNDGDDGDDERDGGENDDDDDYAGADVERLKTLRQGAAADRFRTHAQTGPDEM